MASVKVYYNYSLKKSALMKLVYLKLLIKKGILEIGLKLIKLRGSVLGFLRNGLTIACLRLEGKLPVVRELFTMDKIEKPTLLKTSL